MNTVTLTVKKTPELFLECEHVNPDAFAGKTLDQIAKLGAYQGKEISTIGDYFTVAGEAGATAADTKIVINGDCTKMKYIGAKMTAGEVVVNSTCDMYTGSWMSGGKLLVKGNVHSFCGLAMKGGEFTVEGNAGNYLGAAYRGDWRGMSGGVLRVKGNAGSDVATFMTGGELIVEGNVDIHIGTHMEGGKIIVKGNANRRVAGQMVKGEVYVFGAINVMMPGFKKIGETELEVDGTKARFTEYTGDMGERHPTRKGVPVYGKLYMKN
ncbi:formylmethanofuran dehydrogenase subunit C [Methanoregula sp.]|jgi:formylmethanofuran dehydrogenase subunit C|uniref:formylmethanofuran dehydrogenase subunit C n=1 Tax=Methanoregula sp. TaxID=2052170 RepID=UPI003C145B1A